MTRGKKTLDCSSWRRRRRRRGKKEKEQEISIIQVYHTHSLTQSITNYTSS